jgi:uncharacterized protein DUF1828
MSLREQILGSYLDAQRGLTEIEQIDEDNVVLSLPLHFSANTRVELAVTRITDKYFSISDMAQTLGELKDAGYGIGGKLKQKIKAIAKSAGVDFAGNHLVRKCSAEELGEAIHQFADVAKTIGDAYLTYGARKLQPEEDELVARVRRIFTEKEFTYKEKQELAGKIETHTVDFYVAPNGTRGVALAVLPNPTQIVAEAWGFKSQDIRSANNNLAVSIVYDSSRAKDVSKTILQTMADVSVPSNAIEDLPNRLAKAGISSHKIKS